MKEQTRPVTLALTTDQADVVQSALREYEALKNQPTTEADVEEAQICRDVIVLLDSAQSALRENGRYIEVLLTRGEN
jgi:hypothetical protein